VGLAGCEVVLGLGGLKDRQADASLPGDADPMTGPDAGGADDATVDAPTSGPDVDAEAESDASEGGGGEGGPLCSPNACGGCGVLDAGVGDACGQCGQYVCGGADGGAGAGTLVCSDPGLNACGGCGQLSGAPSAACGCNGQFQFVCSADKTSVTCNDPGANACGGCGTLSAAPGGSCGSCGQYACNAGNTAVTCSDPGLNACGGCGALAGAPNAACGSCGKFACNGTTAVKCNDPGTNACGGCGTLTATVGAACGTCGKYACTAAKTAVTCNDPGTTNSCPTWCSSQSPPSGVAASDFQCLDFDHGLPSGSVWALATANAGTAKISTAAYDSAPNSLQTIANAGSLDQGTLTWTGGGPTPIKGFTVTAAINYTRQNGNYSTDEGSVSLIDILTGFSEVVLYHSGAGLAFAAGSGPTAGGVFFCQCPIGVSELTSSIWNTVSISADIASGNITTTIDGTTETCGCSFKQDTSITVQIGANGDQDPTTAPTFGWSGYWDNVTVAVRR
jgi:hypothetical protein